MAPAFQRGDQPVSEPPVGEGLSEGLTEALGDPSAASPTSGASRTWRALRGALSLSARLIAAALALPLLAVSLVAALWALAHGEAFSGWLLRQLPGVTVADAHGALLGDFSAARIDVALPRGGRLWLMAPRWQGLRLVLDANATYGLGLRAESLIAERLELNWVSDPASPPSKAPDDLRVPLSLQLPVVAIAEARSALWGSPMQQLRVSVALRNDGHQVQVQSLRWSGWQVGPQGMFLRVGAASPMPVQMSVSAVAAASAVEASGSTSPTAMPGALSLQMRGPLADLSLNGWARWAPAHGEAQTLDLDARLQPFAAWPLAQARVVAHALDVSALQPEQRNAQQPSSTHTTQALPRTRLDGRLTLTPNGPQGLALDIDLNNTAAAPWDMGGLPMLSLKGQVVAPLAQQSTKADAKAGQTSPNRISDVLRGTQADVRMTLPSLPGRAPGTVTLQGVWSGVKGDSAPVRLTLNGVQTQALHAAAPPVLLQGSLNLQPAWGANLVEPLRQVGVSAQLAGRYGRLHARPVLDKATATAVSSQDQAIALDLEGNWSPDVWTLRTLRLRSTPDAGTTSEARLNDVRLLWTQAQAWQAQGTVSFERFDPQVWLPWPRQLTDRNSLSAQGTFNLNHLGIGQADLALQPSTLANLPLGGELHWRAKDVSSMQLQADLELAGNRVHALGQGVPAQPLGGDWQVQVSAGQLQALAPLAPLLGLQKIQGAVQLDARWQGAWPPKSSHGTMSAEGVSVIRSGGAALTLASASGQWTWGASAIPSMQARFTLKGLRSPGAVIDQALATLDGPAEAHRLRIEADGHAVAQAVAQPVHASVAVDGSWQAQDDNFAWRGRLAQASVNQIGSTPSPVVLANIQPTDIVWQQTQQGQSLNVQPTRIQASGADIMLERLRWQGGIPAKDSSQDALDVSLRLAPLNVPQWLAQWQPQAGWGGDLTVGGLLRMLRQPGQALEIDAELVRQSGDLTLSEPTVEGQTAQRMGLREARASLKVRNGLWTLQQTLDGRVLGRLSGHQTVQARDPAGWPAADAPMSGEVDIQVSSLRPLATWAPAGWRLNGQLQGHAQLGGTLGQPSWTGWLQGDQLALSQSLLGVHLSEGQLRMDLDGNRARLTRFVASDGSQGGTQAGRLLADGEVTLGSASTPPQLQLHVQAERFAALQRIDRRIVLSGDTQTTYSEDTLRVRGRVLIDEGLIDISHSTAPTLGDDVTVRRRPGQPDDEVASSDGDAASSSSARGKGAAQRKVDADITLDLGQQLRLKGHGVDGLLAGQLHVLTPMNKPSIQGTVKLQQGTFAAYGQKLRIERSTITFTGLIDNPRLDILAMRPQSPAADESDVHVGVRITGTALDPRIRLYSEPSLSETEQLSWLVLGRAPTGLGGADIGLLQTAAVALLSGESREGPTDKIIGLLGLDNLSVSQTEGTVRDTVINVGKQVSRHWYVGYEHNLNATGGNLQLIYSLAQRFKLRAQAGGDNAIDLIWQWRWD